MKANIVPKALLQCGCDFFARCFFDGLRSFGQRGPQCRFGIELHALGAAEDNFFREEALPAADADGAVHVHGMKLIEGF